MYSKWLAIVRNALISYKKIDTHYSNRHQINFILNFVTEAFGNKVKATHFQQVEFGQLNEAAKCQPDAIDIGQEIEEIQTRIQERTEKK